MLMLMFGMRMLATFLTVTAGGTGGFFIPLAVQGVILGNLVGTLLDATGIGTNDSLWPILGLAAFLAAGYRTPIAAVMFVAERTGGGAAVVPALIAAAFSQLVAGKSSVAKGQHAERLGHLEGRLQLPLSSALTTDTLTVPPDATVSEFVWIHAVGRREPVVPVVEAGKYQGMCSLEAATSVERSEWDSTTVAQIVDDDAPVALPNWSLRDAVAAMDAAGLEQLAVTTADGAFVGIVLESEIVKLEEILAETGGDSPT
jgi:CIC family chloride channel protein